MIRQFKCFIQGCDGITPFDLSHMKQAGMNFVTCSKCGKKFVGTYHQSCCSAHIKFATVEEGNTPSHFNIQAFRK